MEKYIRWYRDCFLTAAVLKLLGASESPGGGLAKNELWGHMLIVLDSASLGRVRKGELLTSAQGLLILLVQKLHFENCSPVASAILQITGVLLKKHQARRQEA